MSLALFIAENADQTLVTELKDQWHKTTITINEPIDDTIFAVLVTVHPDWVADQWLTSDDDSNTQRIAEAFKQGKRIVPVSLDDAEWDDEHIAPSVQKLVGRAGVSVHPQDVFQLSEQIEDLVGRLEKLMPKQATSIPTTTTPEPEPTKPDVVATPQPVQVTATPTEPVSSTEEKPKRKSIYEPIRLPKPKYFSLLWQSAIVGLIPFAIYGFTFNVEYSRWAEGYFYSSVSETSVMLTIAMAVAGFGVGWLWRTRLPSNQFSPFIIGATWGISAYLISNNTFTDEASTPVGLLALLTMPIGHLIAYWNSEHKRWWATNSTMSH